MKKNAMMLLLLLLTMSLTVQEGVCQTVEQGHLTMELTEVKVDKPEMEQMVAMMQGSTQEIYFTQEKQKIVIGLMGGMMNIQIFQSFGDKSMETYMDMMGNKIKTTMDEAAINKQQAQSAKIMESAAIKYDRSDKKQIIGYNCHKATLTVQAGANPTEFTFYVTDDIKVPQAYIQNLSQISLEGTPLEMTVGMAGIMKMTYVAKNLEKSVPNDFFAKPSGEYKEMSAEELQKMGMGGGSFGF